MTALANAPYDLLTEVHDTVGTPSVHYLVLSVPRSGSTLLTEGLAATGVMGVPTEYFEFGATVPYLAARWQARDFSDYVETLLRRRTTPNGVFGAKIHWHHLVNLGRQLTSLTDFTSLLHTLDLIIPAARLVRITRHDRLAAAISNWKASHTAAWASVQKTTGKRPTYDFGEITRHLDMIDLAEEGWDRFEAAAQRDVLTVDYDTLVTRYSETIESVIHHVGVGDEPAPIGAPRLSKQADDWNLEMYSRYERELAESGVERVQIPA